MCDINIKLFRTWLRWVCKNLCMVWNCVKLNSHILKISASHIEESDDQFASISVCWMWSWITMGKASMKLLGKDLRIDDREHMKPSNFIVKLLKDSLSPDAESRLIAVEVGTGKFCFFPWSLERMGLITWFYWRNQRLKSVWSWK